MTRTHWLKCWPVYFEPLRLEWKRCDVRLNDRDFRVGDLLVLREWDPATQSYTERRLEVRVTHILENFSGIVPGYAVLSVMRVN